MLRSLDKRTGQVWPSELRQTFAGRLAQDQVSMLNPFGAFIVPPLAEAAGVFHTGARLVDVPDDPRLGGPYEGLTNRLALFELRADENLDDVASVGFAEEAMRASDFSIDACPTRRA